MCIDYGIAEAMPRYEAAWTMACAALDPAPSTFLQIDIRLMAIRSGGLLLDLALRRGVLEPCR